MRDENNGQIFPYKYRQRKGLFFKAPILLGKWSFRMPYTLISNQNALIKDWSNTILSNIGLTQTSVFEHQTNSNVFIFKESNSNTPFLALKKRTSNMFQRITSFDFQLDSWDALSLVIWNPFSKWWRFYVYEVANSDDDVGCKSRYLNYYNSIRQNRPTRFSGLKKPERWRRVLVALSVPFMILFAYSLSNDGSGKMKCYD